MADLPHIILPRVEFEEPRRRSGFGRPPVRDYREHGPALRQQVNEVVQAFQARRPPDGINPALILRIQIHPGAVVEEEAWERCGLTLLSVEQDKTLVLFSTDGQLLEFRQRLERYQAGPQGAVDQNAPYTSIFASIDRVAAVQPGDRIGRLLRTAGIHGAVDFPVDQMFVVDLELWDFGSYARNNERVNQIEGFIRAHGGDCLLYTSPSPRDCS